MSAIDVAPSGRRGFARASALSGPRSRALAVAACGALLAAAALLLIVLTARAEVAPPGAPGAGRSLLRLGSGAAMLALGALLLAHLPRHPLSWILCLAGFGALLAAATGAYAIHGHFVAALPGAVWAGWVSEWASAAILLVPAVALLLFPDGHLLPGRRWRAALWCGLAATALVVLEGALSEGEDLAFQGNPFWADDTARAVGDPFGIGWLLMVPATLAGLRAVARRRREATGQAREQLRLLQRAAAGVGLAFLACLAGSFAAPAAFDLGAVAAVGSLSVLAVVMAVAILRHRLFGIDVYINRALVLSGTSVLLAGLYVGIVLVVSGLLGEGVDLAVALPATAAVAVAAHPVRLALQRSVNRLLHGRRDEPYAAVSLLGRRLADAMAPPLVLPALVESIADAMALPYVAVELDRPGAAPAAAHGQPVAGVALRLPLVHAGGRMGTLLLGARAHGETLTGADRRLLDDVARLAGAVVGAVVLSSELQRSRERIVSAREEERRRLRRDLHDGLGPTLAGAVLTIDGARRVLRTDAERADALLDRAAASVEATVADVRRVVYGLRPPALDDLGLAGAVRQQAATLSTGPAELACDVRAPDPLPPLPAAVEVAALRFVQEALTNVVRHARATRVQVTIEVSGALEVVVADDGHGIRADRPAGVGLTSMRERAAELGGTVSIGAAHDGPGTRLALRLPLGR